MIRSEGQDPQHFTISRRTTNRRRRHLRTQESTNTGSSLVKSESRDFSTSDGSSSDSEDLYQYQHKKRRVMQAYSNKPSVGTGQECTSDGSSSSGSVNSSSPTKILGPPQTQIQKSIGKTPATSPAKKSELNVTTGRPQSVPSPSNEVQIKTEPFFVHQTPKDYVSSIILQNVLKPLNQNSIMNVPSYVTDLTPLHPTINTRTSSNPSQPSGNGSLVKVSDPPSANLGSSHYPFYLLVEAAVQMREIEIRMQQAAQWNFQWSSK